LPELRSAGISLIEEHELEDATLSIQDLQERTARFLKSFRTMWHGAKGVAPNAVALLRQFFTFTNDLNEVLGRIEEDYTNPPPSPPTGRFAHLQVDLGPRQPHPIFAKLKSQADELSWTAVALVEMHEAFEAGRGEALAEGKSHQSGVRTEGRSRHR